jgi:hypothetical protein
MQDDPCPCFTDSRHMTSPHLYCRLLKKYKGESFLSILSDLVRSRETPAELARQPRPWTERSEGSGLALARRKANDGALNHVQ